MGSPTTRTRKGDEVCHMVCIDPVKFFNSDIKYQSEIIYFDYSIFVKPYMCSSILKLLNYTRLTTRYLFIKKITWQLLTYALSYINNFWNIYTDYLSCLILARIVTLYEVNPEQFMWLDDVIYLNEYQRSRTTRQS